MVFYTHATPSYLWDPNELLFELTLVIYHQSSDIS